MTYSIKAKDKAVHNRFVEIIKAKEFTTRSEVLMELIKAYVKKEEKLHK